mgnify:FL=1
MKFDDLVREILEAKEAPEGKHYDSAGILRSGDADADGRGGPKYRSDPTYKNPNEDDEKKKSDKVKVYKGKDYKVKVEKGKKFTKNGIYMKVYYQNPSLSKERHKQIANQIHRAISDEEAPEEDAEYRGRKVKLNKPTRGDVKKFKVYVKDPKTGNVKKVNFGHGGTSAKRKGEKTMKIRKSNPKARKSFRARHNCDNPGPKTKARYWSCRKW